MEREDSLASFDAARCRASARVVDQGRGVLAGILTRLWSRKSEDDQTSSNQRTLKSFQKDLKRPRLQRKQPTARLTPRSLSVDPIVVECAAGEFDDFRTRHDMHSQTTIDEGRSRFGKIR